MVEREKKNPDNVVPIEPARQKREEALEPQVPPEIKARIRDALMGAYGPPPHLKKEFHEELMKGFLRKTRVRRTMRRARKIASRLSPFKRT